MQAIFSLLIILNKMDIQPIMGSHHHFEMESNQLATDLKYREQLIPQKPVRITA